MCNSDFILFRPIIEIIYVFILIAFLHFFTLNLTNVKQYLCVIVIFLDLFSFIYLYTGIKFMLFDKIHFISHLKILITLNKSGLVNNLIQLVVLPVMSSHKAAKAWHSSFFCIKASSRDEALISSLFICPCIFDMSRLYFSFSWFTWYSALEENI